MIANLPPEAAEAVEETARKLALVAGIAYEDALARTVAVLEAFDYGMMGRQMIVSNPAVPPGWMIPGEFLT